MSYMGIQETTIKASQRVEVAEAMSKHLKKELAEVKTSLTAIRDELTMARADLVMVRVDLVLEKKERKVELTMANEKLAEVKREAKITIKKYKAFLDFVAKVARVIAAFQASE